MKKSLIFSCLALAVFGLGFFMTERAQATTSSNLVGWAWSSNIGWVSFNSNLPSATPTSVPCGTYCVSVSATGDMSGYAWSSSIGWLSFNATDISGCPGATAPKVTNGVVSGWARFLTGKDRTDGWDGCVELADSGAGALHPSQAGSNKGVYMDPTTGTFSGFAWGSDVVGWLKFNPNNASIPPVTCTGGGCGGGGGPTFSGQCTANPSSTLNEPIDPNEVQFTATASGGTSPYVYSWDGGSTYSTTNTNTPPEYTTSGAGPTLLIRDSSGGPATPPIFCPYVYVSNIPLALKIGTPASISGVSIDSTSGNTAQSVTQGNPFSLKWKNVYAADAAYNCAYRVTPQGTAPAPLAAWSVGWGTSNGPASNSYNTTGFNLGTENSATYVFQVSCTKISDGSAAVSSPKDVTLIIKKSSIHEI
jgi:hypothetical protein